jgi:hypothetical protein
MRTRSLFASILTIACLWPIVTRAAEMEMPELGIHLVDMPAGVEKPAVKRRIDGYTATLHIGTATLKIDRFDEAVPSGSDIKNDSFRTAQVIHPCRLCVRVRIHRVSTIRFRADRLVCPMSPGGRSAAVY